MNDTPKSEDKLHAASGTSLKLDLEKYRPYFEGSNLSEEEADAILSAYWELMVQFVDIAFAMNTASNMIHSDFGPPSDDFEKQIEDMLSSYSAKRDEEQRGPRHDDD